MTYFSPLKLITKYWPREGDHILLSELQSRWSGAPSPPSYSNQQAQKLRFEAGVHHPALPAAERHGGAYGAGDQDTEGAMRPPAPL